MVSSHASTVKFACPACRAAYEVPAKLAGQKGPCAKCGGPITVPRLKDEKATAAVETIWDEEEKPRQSQYIAVHCRVCQTLMHGTHDQVGKEVKCPDCGARTVVPPPPAPKSRNLPAALDGEQYELWDADEAPTTSELIAAQPTYIEVRCSLCETLMQATADQVGQLIACPDCGRTNVVPPPPPIRPKPQVITKDAPSIDRSADPGERPAYVPVRSRPMMHEEAAEAARAEMAADPKKALRRYGQLDARGRPIIPRYPLVTGILPFLFSSGVPALWLGLGMGFGLGVFLILDGLAWGSAGGLATFSALMTFVTGGLICFILSAATSAVFLTIVTESSDGNQEIQNWNIRYISEWFPDLLYLVSAASIGALPGGLAVGLITEDPWLRAAAGAAGALVIFPIAYLSQLHNSSPFGVVSGRVLASFGKCPGSWLLFYVESFLIWGFCFAAIVTLVSLEMSPAIAVPLCVAALFLYARLLGRLGWRMAEAMSGIEEKSKPRI